MLLRHNLRISTQNAAHFTLKRQKRLENLKWHYNNHAYHITAYLGFLICWPQPETRWCPSGMQPVHRFQVLSRPLQQFRNKGGWSIRSLSDCYLRQVGFDGSLTGKWRELLQKPVLRSIIFQRLQSRVPCTKLLLNAKQKGKQLQLEWTEKDRRKMVFSNERQICHRLLRLKILKCGVS